jgi:hypothetical protein
MTLWSTRILNDVSEQLTTEEKVGQSKELK